jgi:mRNA-degrading endonuclease RelE of RelBE toxin-antitoxin system
MTHHFLVVHSPLNANSEKYPEETPRRSTPWRSLIALLAKDPHGRSGQHPIKKLEGVKPGEGQWRVRWGEYRLRYDIFGREVVLHSFRHRQDAY